MRLSTFITSILISFGINAQTIPNLEKISKSVVMIKIYDHYGDYFGHASGFVIDSTGIVVTNQHVVNAGKLEVITDRGGVKKTYKVESILKENELTDVATIKIKNPNKEYFNYIKTTSVLPKLGEKCWAIGTPADTLYMNTISEGIVSKIYKEGIYDWKGLMLQTSAEITHGSSGGLLLNKNGEAIGITSGGDETTDGARASINWAISISELSNLSPSTRKLEIINSIPSAPTSTSTTSPSTQNQPQVSYGNLSFFTESYFTGSIRIYIDGIYIGEVVNKINCGNIPECGSKNLFTHKVTYGRHSYTAVVSNTGETIRGLLSVTNSCQYLRLNLKNALEKKTVIQVPIKIKVSDITDTTEVFLIKYFGSKLFYADTACMINGEVIFDGTKQKPGIVGLFLPGQRYFEFVYNNEEIQLETKGPDFMANMVVKKSVENQLFIPYVKFISSKKGEINKLAEQRAKLKPEDAEYTTLTTQIDLLNKEVEKYQADLVSQNPGKLVSKIVLMSTEVVVPEPPKDANGNLLDSNFRYKYYFAHYWDNVDLKTDALVNNPIFANKLEFYFGKQMMIQHWDTIIKYAFQFCDALDPKSRMYEYSVGWIASTYGKSEIMGMDKVYYYMLKRYFCTKDASGKSPAFWVAEDKFEDLCENLDNKMNTVMGIKPPNLIMRDTSDTKWIDFYSLTSEYTILYFWDPECGHCKKVTPKIQTLYTEKWKARNIEVFAVGKGVGKDFEAWKKYIRDAKLTFINVAVTNSIYEIAKATPEKLVPLYPGEKGKPTTLQSLNYQQTYDIYSTPKVFVLDKDKKIIAKNLSVSQLEDMLDKLQNKSDAPKLFPPDPEEDEHMQKD